MQRNRKGPAAKRQRGEDGAGKAVAAKNAQRGGRGNGVKNYWQKMGAEFEISSEEDKEEWSDSDLEDEMIGDEIEIQADDQQEAHDTASAIVRRWKQAQKEQGKGEKRKLTEDDDEEELKDEFVLPGKEHAEEASAGEEEGDGENENGDEGEGEGGEDDDVEAEDEEPTEEVPRVRKGPGSVSFAMVLGQLLAPAGGTTSEAAATEAESAEPAGADPILKNFKKRTNRKLEAEKRRRREAREMAVKKKLLKARDHRVPTVLAEPAEVRLRKLATRGAVQLFNVVRKQQKMMAEENTEELEKKNPLKAEKLSKTKFLELLQKTGGKAAVKREAVKAEEETVKREQQAKPQWDVLSDDYMLGAALKDMPDDEADD